MSKIFVLGSINMDLVISVSKLPEIGESKQGHSFIQNQGGKGANQAVACKKLGCEEVYLLAAVGNDENGKSLIKSMENYNIKTENIKIKNNTSSGVCMIILDEEKQDNLLIVDAGANFKIEPNDFVDFLKSNAKKGDIFITQLEVSLPAVYAGLRTAKQLGMYTILNPAPVIEIDKNCLINVDLIVPNETETKLLSGITIENDQDLKNVYEYFSSLGVKEVLITLGSKGSAYITEREFIKCNAKKVKAVDTTSAGDTFIGAFAISKMNGKSIKESLEFASLCSSITVSRKGAAISIPTEEEIKEILK